MKMTSFLYVLVLEGLVGLHRIIQLQLLQHYWLVLSLVAQMVKRLSAMLETQVRSLDWEDPLEKEMATHSSVLDWRIPGTGEPWWTAVYGVTQSWTRLKLLSSMMSYKTF